MIADPLGRVLEATGYFVGGQPAASSVSLAQLGAPSWLPALSPDAWWRSGATVGTYGSRGPAGLTVCFKSADAVDACGGAVAGWQQAVWNLGSAPLFWVISRDRVDIYNGFGTPQLPGRERINLLRSSGHSEAELAALDEFAGRLAMETGEFWSRWDHPVNRKTGVDARLLAQLVEVERDLTTAGLGRNEAQGLIGRTVFAKYLVDRKIVTGDHLRDLCGRDDLAEILHDHEATERLFGWLRDSFNGDMFSPSIGAPPNIKHLRRVARFLRAEESGGQISLFPYQFDVIPVELISSIYERFVHSAASANQTDEPSSQGARDVHYTPISAVSLMLDQVFDGLTGDESVLDLTCGSGVFLVEALRRLVRLKAKGSRPSRAMVREVLYRQIYGVDISPAAIRIAAFSLYLAALELDPDPRSPRSRRFEPLVGRTLLVGDARDIEDTEAGKRVLKTNSGLKQFDAIVGNPPWSYRGRAGTASRRQANSETPLPPRGQGFDFVRRGLEFAHAETRFGVLVSAMPFFSRSGTGEAAAHDVVDSLGPLTLVNLSELSGWLFPNASMPAMAVLTRQPSKRPKSLELVQGRWSLQGDRSHTIDLVASDVASLPVASWKRNSGLLKAAFLGHKHDLLLLDALWERSRPLKGQLNALGTKLASGLKVGNRSNEASLLAGLPFASTGTIGRFRMPRALPPFDGRPVERPRTRTIYRSPLLFIRAYITGGQKDAQDGRPVVAVSEQDIVFSDNYFGVSLFGAKPDIAYLLAGVLSSSLASWYYLMTGSMFGLWRPRLLIADIASLPVPDLRAAVETDVGARIVRLVRGFHRRSLAGRDWRTLDEAVFELYDLDAAERIVAEDGWLRAAWDWKAGRIAATAPAGKSDIERYARAFLLSMDTWMYAANERRFRAEIHDIVAGDPLRVVRFVLEDDPPPSTEVQFVPRNGSLHDLLAETGARLGRPIVRELVGSRELRVHGRQELVIIKPAARRFWLGVAGLDDARAVMIESVLGHPT